MTPRRIALVIPWFSWDARGGAMLHARELARRLAERGHHIDILTTCSASPNDDWGHNRLDPGLSRDFAVTIRRFLVDRRDSARFAAANQHFLRLDIGQLRNRVATVSPQAEADFCHHGLPSRGLAEYLERAGRDYDRIIFLPYCYTPTLELLPSLAERSILLPCLHEEAYAHMARTRQVFHAARSLAFLSAGEAALAEDLFGPRIRGRSLVCGAGIEQEDLAGPHAVPTGLEATEPFFLVLGQRGPEKGLPHLLAAWARAFTCPAPVRLVLAGPGDQTWGSDREDVVDLGPVGAEERRWLLHHCRVLCNPSPNESYSRVLFEAWACSRPVLVHRQCRATSTAVDACGGGRAVATLDDWAAALRWAATADEAELADLGQRGRAHAQTYGSWDRCLDRYESLLEDGPPAQPARGPRRRAIHQILAGVGRGDAISNQAFVLRSWFRQAGYESEILAEFVDPALVHEVRPLRHEWLEPADGLLYHHSIGSAGTTLAQAHPGPKALLYHNITPPAFFAGFDRATHELLRRGHHDLPGLAANFSLRLADSAFNADELQRLTGLGATVVPLPIEPRQWPAPDPTVAAALATRPGPHLLFVGRIAPNKCQHEFPALLAELEAGGCRAEAWLVGLGHEGEAYRDAVAAAIAGAGLEDRCHLVGHVDQAQLAAYFQAADVYVSLSRHEGFGVPLIEAAGCGLPVVTRQGGAAGTTIAGAGLVLDDEAPLAEIAAAVRRIVDDRQLAASLIANGRTRQAVFAPQALRPTWFQALEPLTTAVARPRIAVVVQRAGHDVAGGAELAAREIGRRLGASCHCELWTTCAVDHATWADLHAPGPDRIGSLPLLRFPVDEVRDPARFSRACQEIASRAGRLSDHEVATWLAAQGPNCRSLVNHVADASGDFDAVLFCTYLYATTWQALPACRTRAVLMPFAHEEWMLHLPGWRQRLARADQVLFMTEEERALWRERVDPAADGPVVGLGIEPPPAQSDGDRFRRQYGIERPFVLYLGRIDVPKGCLQLVEHHRQLLADDPDAPDLVLVGREVAPVPRGPGIHIVGWVDEQTRWDAIAAALALVQPSRHESLSLVLLEALASGRPVLAQGECAVTTGQLERLGGGHTWLDANSYASAVRAAASGAIPVHDACAAVRARYAWPALMPRIAAALLVTT